VIRALTIGLKPYRLA